MLKRDDVINAFRLILERSPESEDVVSQLLATHSTIGSLRSAFVDSEEFQSRIKTTDGSAPIILVGRHSGAQQINVQLSGPPEQLARMYQRVATCWEKLGNEEPHWSVLSAPAYLSGSIAQHESAFYASGFYDLGLLRSAFERAGHSIGKLKKVLELGCGVARVTSALATQFSEVVGTDISKAHLKIAHEHVQKNRISNVSLFHLPSIGLLSDVRDYDMFYSVIVLQHNPPPIILSIVRTVLSNLNRGGFAYFQVPTYCPSYSFLWDEYLRLESTDMEMHVLPQSAIFRCFKEIGITLLEVQEDTWTGDPSFVSNTFFVQKE